MRGNASFSLPGCVEEYALQRQLRLARLKQFRPGGVRKRGDFLPEIRRGILDKIFRAALDGDKIRELSLANHQPSRHDANPVADFLHLFQEVRTYFTGALEACF